MSKKFYKDQVNICQYIFDDYVSDKEMINIGEVLKNVNMLVDNGLAIKISGEEDLDDNIISKYRLASKMMVKYNKLLKDHLQVLDVDYGYHYSKSPNTNPELVELSKYGLRPGIYFAYLGKKKSDDYAVLKVEANRDYAYVIQYELFFVGYKCDKFKNKFFKMYDKYDKMRKEIDEEGILYTDGRPFQSMKFKSFDQMIFKDKNKIIDYVDNWVKNIPEYYKFGMTPKLSILLHGDPGTGKSTFTKALAKHLGIDRVMTIDPSYFSNGENEANNPGRRATSMGRYVKFINSIDDIDCICKSREEDNSNENNKVLSSLLEFLDNPPVIYYKSTDGLYYPISIVVATTNYIDRLDDAVKRYGRFDLKIEMGQFNVKEAEEMCKIYNLTLRDVYKDPIDKGFKISPSQLQALCLENIDKSLKKQK